jgi:hypothetical protein
MRCDYDKKDRDGNQYFWTKSISNWELRHEPFMRAFFIKILKSDLVKVVTFAYREYAIEFRD